MSQVDKNQKGCVWVVTQDEALWQRCQCLRTHGWALQWLAALPALWAQSHQAGDMVILDARVPGLPSWADAAMQQLLKRCPTLVLSPMPSDELGYQVLEAGAQGFAHVYTAEDALPQIMGSLAQGAVWVGRSLLSQMLRNLSQRLPAPAATPHWAQGLTPREQEVAQMAAVGASNQATAQSLDITERTVRAHMSAILEKLQVSDRLMLALKVHGIQASSAASAESIQASS